MDNVTHTIAGLLVAQAVTAARARRGIDPSRAFVVAASVVSAAANNLPDLDFLYARITAGKLGYLLHHRGHTHTVLAAVAGAILVFLAVLPFRRRMTQSELGWISGLAIVGTQLHIAMDFTNNYGVHPFWPFDNRWFYGDAVFIIEPWYWVFAVPSLVFSSRNVVLRAALALVLVVGLALAWSLEIVSWGVALALTVASVATTVAALRLGAFGRMLLGCVGSAVVVLVFATTSQLAKRELSTIEVIGGAEHSDVVLTPGPGNPLCFSAIIVDDDGSRYRLRRATVAALPWIVPVALCRAEGWETNVSTAPTTSASTDGVRWIGEWSAPRAELRRLNQNCDAQAFLRFSRAPYWLTLGHDALYLGDLRYDRDKDEDFSELRVPEHPRDCPRWVPPWVPPRADILN